MQLLCWHTLSPLPKTLISNADVWGKTSYLWGLQCCEISLWRTEKNRIWIQATNQNHGRSFVKLSILDPRAFLVAQWERINLLMQEKQVPSLGQEDPLEKEMAAHSSILTWEIPWTEEPGGLQSMGLQKVGYNWGTKQQQHPRLPPTPPRPTATRDYLTVLASVVFPKFYLGDYNTTSQMRTLGTKSILPVSECQ